MIPLVIPTPAVINATSLLAIIPTPTLKPLLLLFNKIDAGNPEPKNFVEIATINNTRKRGG